MSKDNDTIVIKEEAAAADDEKKKSLDINEINKELIDAARNENDLEVKELIKEYKEDIYTGYPGEYKQRSVLHVLAKNGNIGLLKLIFELQTNIDKRDWYGWTALMLAVYYEHQETIEYLVDKGANISIRSFREFEEMKVNSSAIDIAKIKGQDQLVIYLRKQQNEQQKIKAADNKASSDEEILLRMAKRNNFNGVLSLLEKKVNVNYQNDNGFAIAHHFAMRGNVNALQVLHERFKVNLNITTNNGVSPLFYACAFSRFEAAKFLLEAKVDTSIRTTKGLYTLREGCTAVSYAKKDIRVYKLFLVEQLKSQINMIYESEPYKSMQNLIKALESKDYSSCEQLFQDDEIEYELPLTLDVFVLIHIVAKHGYIPGATKIIQESHEMLNKIDLYNWTPMMHALAVRQEEMAIFLFNQDADITIISDMNYDGFRTGSNAISIAKERDCQNFLQHIQSVAYTKPPLSNGELLLQACAKNDENLFNISLSMPFKRRLPQDKDGRGCLHWLCYHNNLNLLTKFLDKLDVDVDIVDKYGFSPLLYAAWLGSFDLLERILSLDPFFGVTTSQTTLEFPQDTSLFMLIKKRSDYENCKSLINKNLGHVQPESYSLDPFERFFMQAYLHGEEEQEISQDDIKLISLAHEKNWENLATEISQVGAEEINKLDKGKRSLCHWLVVYNQSTILEEVISKGGNINLCDKAGWTCLMLSVIRDDQVIIDLLLQHNPNFDVRSSYEYQGFSAGTDVYTLAKLTNNEKILAMQTDILPKERKSQEQENYPSLLQTEEKKVDPLLKQLLEYKNEGNNDIFKSVTLDKQVISKLVGEDSRHLLHWIAFYGDLELLDLCIKAKVDINVQDAAGWTALMVAVVRKHTSLISKLIDAGCNTFARTTKSYQCWPQGSTALSLAQSLDDLELVEAVQSITQPCLSPNRAMFHAIMNDDEKAFEKAISDGANVNSTVDFPYNRYPLQVALRNNKFKIVELLLTQHNANPNICDEEGWTPLMYAAINNRHKSIRLLINSAADINATTNKAGSSLPAGTNVFDVAKEKGNEETKALLNCDAIYSADLWKLLDAVHEKDEEKVAKILEDNDDIDIDFQDPLGRTALHIAAKHLNAKIVSLLMKYDANPDLTEEHGLSPFMYAMVKNDCRLNYHVLVELLRHRCKIDCKSSKKVTLHNGKQLPSGSDALTLAQLLNVQKVVALIKGQKQVESAILCRMVDRNLIKAVENNKISDAVSALEKGANPNSDSDGKPVVVIAVEKQYYKLLKLLLENEADPNRTYSVNGVSALYMAAENGDVKACRMLMSHQELDINISTAFTHRTPFYAAAYHNQVDIMKLMVRDEHLDDELRNGGGFTPLLIAISCGNLSAVKYLVEERKCDITATIGKKTALHIAAENKSADVLNYLLYETSINIDLNKESDKGYTPLISAAMQGSLACLQALIKFARHKMNIAVDDNNTPIDEKILNVNYQTTNPKLTWDPTALYACVAYKHTECVKFLVGVPGIQVNQMCGNQWAPLTCASSNGDIEMVEALLSHPDISLDLCNDKGTTALHTAADNGHANVVKLLLKHPKSSANYATPLEEYSPLFNSVGYGSNGLTTKALLSDRRVCQMVNERNSDTRYMTASLNRAVLNYSIESTFYILQTSQADINIDDYFSLNPLYNAIENGIPTIIKLLLSHPKISFNYVSRVTSKSLDDITREKASVEIKSLLKSNSSWPKQPSLIQAIIDQDQDQLIKLVANPEININQVSDSGKSSLYIACETKNLEALREILKRDDLDLNKPSEAGYTPLMAAAMEGFVEGIKLLKDTAVDVNSRYTDGATALWLACSHGKTLAVEALTEFENIDVNIARLHRGNDGIAPLHKVSNAKMVRAILKCKDANPNIRKAEWTGATTPLLVNHACINEDDKKIDMAAITKALLEHPLCDPNLGNIYTGNTPLLEAIIKKDKERALILVEDERTNLSYRCNDGEDAVLLAAYHDLPEVLNALLKKPNSSVVATDLEGHDALYYAVAKGHVECVDIILDYTSTKTFKLNRIIQGRTLLYIAAEAGDILSVKKLLKQQNIGIDTAHLKTGNTPLMIAASNGYIEVVKVLIEQSADITLRNNDGLNAKQLAYMHNDLVKLLQQKESELAIKELDNDTLQLKGNYKRTNSGLTSKLIELEQTKKSMMDAIAGLSIEIDKMRQLQDDVEDVKKKCDIIDKDIKRNDMLGHVIEHINTNDKLRSFSSHMEHRLSAFFMGYFVISSGLVKGDTKLGGGEVLKDTIELAGELVPIPGISFICKLIVNGIEAKQERAIEKQAHFIARLIRTATGMDEEIMETARYFTLKYEPQIQQLNETAAQTFAETMLIRFMIFLHQGEIVPHEHLGVQLTNAVDKYDSIRFQLPKTFRFKAKKLQVQSKKKLTWTDEGLLYQSGIITVQGTCFSTNNCEVLCYGYHFGDISEIQRRQFGKCNHNCQEFIESCLETPFALNPYRYKIVPETADFDMQDLLLMQKPTTSNNTIIQSQKQEEMPVKYTARIISGDIMNENAVTTNNDEEEQHQNNSNVVPDKKCCLIQ